MRLDRFDEADWPAACLSRGAGLTLPGGPDDVDGGMSLPILPAWDR